MRRYSSKEMSEILKLANEMKESGAGGTGDGFSLAEVQSVAGEMGMDPVTIAAAAAQFDKARQGADPNQPNHYHFDRDIPFVLSDAGWERIVDQLRVNSGVTGTIRERADGSREWINVEGGETIIATLTVSGTTSRFELNVNRTEVVTLVKMAFSFLIGFTALIGTAIASKGGFVTSDFVALALVIGLELGLVLWMRPRLKRAADERFASLVDKAVAAAVPQAQILTGVLSPQASSEGDQIHTNS